MENASDESDQGSDARSQTTTQSLSQSHLQEIHHERKVWPKFEDLGGIKEVLEELSNVLMPLSNPQVPKRLGIVPMAGLLLHGPSGSGKTTLAHAIANETGYPLYTFSVSDVTSTPGASEETIRKVFLEAYQNAPSIIFIDNIDALAPKRQNLKEDLARQIVTQLMRSMDELQQALQNDDAHSRRYVLIIGATTRLHANDPGVKQSGLFNHEIALGIPNEARRFEILKLITKRARLDAEVDLLKIARSTPGFLVAHLKALVDNARKLSIGRLIKKSESNLNVRDFMNTYVEAESNFLSLTTTMTDFENAIKIVQSSLRREGFSSIPNVTWDVLK